MAYEYSPMDKIVNFHLLIDNVLWNDLKEINYFGQLPVLRKATGILTFFFQENGRLPYEAGDEATRPVFIGPSHDVHVKMPREVYYWLKNVHDTQNVHGMAQIVRAVLRYYVELVKTYGRAKGEAIFTGHSAYRVCRALVRLKRRLFPKNPTFMEYLIQLGRHQFICDDFVKEFVVLME